MIEFKTKELYQIKQKVLGSSAKINDIVMCLGNYNSNGIYIFFNLRTSKQMVFSDRENVLISLREL